MEFAAAAATPAPGDRVRIRGLASKPHLNGTVAVVLEPDALSERDKLAKGGRVKLTSVPKPIAVKAVNCELLLDSEHPDWTFLDISPTESVCLQQVVLRSPMGKISACDEFVRKMREYQSPGEMPIHRINQQLLDTILRNTAPHCVYYMYLDHIGHHLLLETHQGRARVFQSYVKGDVSVIGVGVCGTSGYSAAEWASPQPDPCWDPSLLEAHRRWGGGRELSYAELVRFVGLLAELQRAADTMEAHLLGKLPQTLLQADKAHWAERAEMEGENTSQCSPLHSWTVHLAGNPHFVTMDDLYGEGASNIYSSLDYDGSSTFRLHLPAALNAPFVAAYVAVAGMAPHGWVYIKLLEYTSWRNRQYLVDSKISTRPVGWTVSASTVPH